MDRGCRQGRRYCFFVIVNGKEQSLKRPKLMLHLLKADGWGMAKLRGNPVTEDAWTAGQSHAKFCSCPFLRPLLKSGSWQIDPKFKAKCVSDVIS